jgi:acyl-coenzyme A thioesterase 13
MSISNSALEALKAHIGRTLPKNPSPFGVWLDPIIRSVEHGVLELEFLVRDEMTNPAGIMHGGVTASMIDETIGMMMYCLGEPHFKASINLVVDFLSAARPGDTLLVKAKLTKQGRNLFHAVAEMIRKDDLRLIATGSAHMYSMVDKRT